MFPKGHWSTTEDDHEARSMRIVNAPRMQILILRADSDPHPVKTVRCGCTNANRHPPFFPYRSRAHCCLNSLAPSLSRTVPLHSLYKPSLARPLSDSSYLPCWEGQAHVSASSTLISCIAQRGLVGVRLSFGDAAGAIFAGLHSRECFFIDCSAWCIALRKKFFC